MIARTIEVCGQPVKFRSSAAIPRLYRAKFGRDIFRDLTKLGKAYKKVGEESFAIEDLEIFENEAYCMAYHADSSIPGTIEEWLNRFEMFSTYQVLPQILEPWGQNMQTEIAAKKARAEVTAR